MPPKKPQEERRAAMRSSAAASSQNSNQGGAHTGVTAEVRAWRRDGDEEQEIRRRLKDRGLSSSNISQIMKKTAPPGIGLAPCGEVRVTAMGTVSKCFKKHNTQCIGACIYIQEYPLLQASPWRNVRSCLHPWGAPLHEGQRPQRKERHIA